MLGDDVAILALLNLIINSSSYSIASHFGSQILNAGFDVSIILLVLS